jgi:hypothetical protein
MKRQQQWASCKPYLLFFLVCTQGYIRLAANTTDDYNQRIIHMHKQAGVLLTFAFEDQKNKGPLLSLPAALLRLSDATWHDTCLQLASNHKELFFGVTTDSHEGPSKQLDVHLFYDLSDDDIAVRTSVWWISRVSSAAMPSNTCNVESSKVGAKRCHCCVVPIPAT